MCCFYIFNIEILLCEMVKHSERVYDLGFCNAADSVGQVSATQ